MYAEQTEVVERHAEGQLAKAIEHETAQLPSDIFLWGGCGAIAGSWMLRLFGRKEAANFMATWAPTILLMGVYNKLVKVHGHDDEGSGKGHGHTPGRGRHKESRSGRLADRAGTA